MMSVVEAAPNCIRTPFLILVDKAEKAPWSFAGIAARSFVDKDMPEYIPQLERRYLGIGRGDYSLDGYQDRVGVERKSMADFQGTLLGWPQDPESLDAAHGRREIHRRGRFKRELATLAGYEAKAVIVEAPLHECLRQCPQWGTRSAGENVKYLFSTYMAWQQEFAVPWIFAEDRRMAEVTAMRLLEKFWQRTIEERREAKANRWKATAEGRRKRIKNRKTDNH